MTSGGEWMSATIKILKKGKEYTVEGKKGETLLTVLNKNGFSVKHPCGGKGKCGKCLVQVTDTNAKPNKLEAELLGNKKMAEGYRVACLVRSDQPMTVLFNGKAQKSKKEVTPVERVQIEPTVKIQTALTKHFFEQGENGYTEVYRDRRLIGIEPGDTRATSFGAAISIDGKRVYATLCNMTTGEMIAKMETTRTSTVHVLISELIEKLITVSGIERKWLYEVVFAPDVTYWRAFLEETGQMTDCQSATLLRMPLLTIDVNAALTSELTVMPAPIVNAGLPAIVAAYHLMDRKNGFLLLLKGGESLVLKKGKPFVIQQDTPPFQLLEKVGLINVEGTEIFVDTGMLGTDVMQMLVKSGLSAFEPNAVNVLARALDNAASMCLLSKKCMKRAEGLIQSVSSIS